MNTSINEKDTFVWWRNNHDWGNPGTCIKYLVQVKGVWIFKPPLLCMTGFIQLMMNVAKDYYTNLYAVDNGGLGSSLDYQKGAFFRRFYVKSE